jgi:Flp pilus assembly pilin Flp
MLLIVAAKEVANVPTVGAVATRSILCGIGRNGLPVSIDEVYPVAKTITHMWREEDGVLSFEWTLLLTLLVIGIVSGVAGARDAIIDELGDVAQAMLALDQTYTIEFPLEVAVHAATSSSASDSSFLDALFYSDCDRTSSPVGQGPVEDGLDGG